MPEGFIVGLGVALDLATYAAKPAQSRYATGFRSSAHPALIGSAIGGAGA